MSDPSPVLLNEDDALMFALQGGEATAFAQLMERHQQSLIGFFVRKLRDVQLAEDLAQETLLRVYITSWDYLPRGKFRGWMFRIARNLLIDNTRKRSHDALVRAVKTRGGDGEDGLNRVPGEVTAVEERAQQHEVSETVDALLPQLPEDQRVAFILYHFCSLSLPEIADATESNLPTTKSRLRLARQKLRTQLERRGFCDPFESNSDLDPEDED